MEVTAASIDAAFSIAGYKISPRGGFLCRLGGTAGTVAPRGPFGS